MSESTSGDPNKTGCDGPDFSSLLQQAVAAEMSRDENVEHKNTHHDSDRLRELENSVGKILQVLDHPEDLPAFKHSTDQLEGRFVALENQMNLVEQTGISAMDDMTAKMASMRQEIVSEFQTRMTAMQNQIATELAGFMVKVNRSLGDVVRTQTFQSQKQSSACSKVPEIPTTSRNSGGGTVEEVSVSRHRHARQQLTGLYASETTESPCSKESQAKSPKVLLDELVSCNQDVQNPQMDTDDNAYHQEQQSASIPHNSCNLATGTKRVLDEESTDEAGNIRKRRLVKLPFIQQDPSSILQTVPQQAHQDQPDFTVVAMQQRPIATKIFEYFSQTDLLNCSLVCKDWNFHAREVLRRKKRCLMHIDFDRNSYTDLRNLSKTLWDAYCLPYWGISVSCCRNYANPKRCILDAKKQQIWKLFEEAVAAKLAGIRCIKVDYTAGYDNNATVGIESVCKRVGDSLEILKFSGTPPAVSKLVDNANPFSNFGKLKELGIPNFKSVKAELGCLSILARAAPKLKAFNGVAEPEWIGHPVFNYLVSRGLIKQFSTHFGPGIMDQCHRFAQMNLKLDELALTYLGNDIGCPPLKQWNRLGPSMRIAKDLLKISSETLLVLDMSLQDLQALYDMNDIPTCPQLQWLCLNLRLENSNGLLRGLNLAQIFPKVEVFEVCYGRWAVRNEFEDLGRPSRSLAFVNTLVLSLRSGSRSGNNSVDSKEVSAVVLSLARLCPHVKHFYAYGHTATHARILLETLWSVWPDLETINIAGIPVSQLRQSFDATICGITEAQANNLRERISEINDVDVAPVLPSILDKTKLQKLRLEIVHDVSSTMNIGERVLSRLSGVLAFQRMPQLTIELYRLGVFYVNRDYLFDLTHLQSMVKIECYNRHLMAFPGDII